MFDFEIDVDDSWDSQTVEIEYKPCEMCGSMGQVRVTYFYPESSVTREDTVRCGCCNGFGEQTIEVQHGA